MRHSNEVKGVRPLGGHKLRVVFTDGYIGDVDLLPLFANAIGPMPAPLQDPEYFQRVTVDLELGVPRWPNGYDICADVLRYYCELGRVAKPDELEKHFVPVSPPSNEPLVLRESGPDEPRSKGDDLKT